MAIGDALSKVWTYGKVEDTARLRSGTVMDTTISASLALDVISQNVQQVAKRIVDSGGYYAKQYLTTNATLTISGSANPYSVNLSSLAPFLDKPDRVVHVTTGGTRTLVKILPSLDEAEQMQSLTSTYGSSIFGAYEGDSLRLYKGSSFTITTATDTIELKYFRQAKVGSVSGTTVISDTAFTIAADGITISAFTGTTSAYVGGLFVGLDNAVAAFVRTIVQYVSATSFIVDTAIAGTGASTNGYIIPPGTSTYTTTRGTYIDVPDVFGDLVITMTAGAFARHRNGGVPDQNLEAKGDAQLNQIFQQSAVEKQFSKKDE